MHDLFAKSAEWLAVLCYAVAVVGCVYALAAAVIAGRFVAAAPAQPASPGDAVTILKPLSGAEPDLHGNLARFCRQRYAGPVQIVFGVADAADPAAAVVRDLIAAFPELDLTLVVCARQHGANRKVSNLINMLAHARHDLLVLSDSDIVVEPDYLNVVTGSLGRPGGGVGLVTVLYRATATADFWARFAAAGVNYHFLPNALVGLWLGRATPCFGSTIALRRDALARIGGFEAVADQLADDYALGALVRGLGLGVAIPPYTVDHRCAERTAGELLRHELRWARTIRAIEPFGYAGLAFTHALPLALLGALLGGVSPACLIVAGALACRFFLAVELRRAFRLPADPLWLGPLRDLASFAIFVISFCGNAVEWRGRRYGVRSDRTIADRGEAPP